MCFGGVRFYYVNKLNAVQIFIYKYYTKGIGYKIMTKNHIYTNELSYYFYMLI